MQDYSRVAIYWTPTGALGDFGARWLGWDIAQGAPARHPEIPGLPRSVAEITQRPRKYGFHATMKAPFTPTAPLEVLREAFAEFCAATGPARAPGMQLAHLGGFVALVPQGDSSALAALAAASVRALEPWRAPLSDAQLARRREAGLSDAQEALLQRWGYPYVMEEFRLHLTMSGRMSGDDAQTLVAALTPAVTPHLPNPLVLDHLSLCGEREDGRFELIDRHALTGE